jgi:hypothetical protein
MTDINIELFKRTSPVRKIEIVNNLTQVELSSISKETILRIVKETGRRNSGTRNYELYIAPERRCGNNWNSEVEGTLLYKEKASVMVYVQFDNTDTSLLIPFNDFFKKGEFRGTVKRDDRYGNPQTYYYVYNEKDKAEVIRSICLEYVNTKYKERLNHINNNFKQQ